MSSPSRITRSLWEWPRRGARFERIGPRAVGRRRWCTVEVLVRLLLAALLLIIAVILMPRHANAQVEISAEPLHEISAYLYSMFVETEINFGGEGGLYAELVRNRDFEALGRGCVDADCPSASPWELPPMEAIDGRDRHEPPVVEDDYRPWSVIGGARIQIDATTAPFSTNPHSLRVECTVSCKGAGVSNPGYWGIAVPRTIAMTRNWMFGHERLDPLDDVSFTLSLYARAWDDAPLHLSARLVEGGRILAEASVHRRAPAVGESLPSDGWAEYRARLTPVATTTKAAALEIFLADDDGFRGAFWLDAVSLFPSDAVGGLFRRDIFEKLLAMKPGFIRLPGGNYLEGFGLRSRWDWKRTIGHWATRPGHYNAAWGYWVTDGFGLYEMLKLCELLGAPAQLSVFTGYSMKAPYAPLNQSAVYAQDALDMLEFANGAPGRGSTWADARSNMGHPTSFRLHRLEVGNEERDLSPTGYAAHYDLITKRLWAAHPELTIVASGRWRDSDSDQKGSPCLTGRRCDILDEHFYQTSDQMASMGGHYDTYNRSLPPVFVGEFAANKPDGAPTLRAAIAESIFMLGFERNADVVTASAFAPLLNNVHGTQWPYNLINFNASHIFCLPSYYAQLMLSGARGSHSLPTTMSESGGRWNAAASLNTDGVVLKLANYDESPRDVTVKLTQFAPRGIVSATATVLTASSPDAVNSLDEPEAVVPQEAPDPTVLAANRLRIFLPAWSLLVVRIRLDTASRRPNILLFEADQARPDAHSAEITPNLNSIMMEGVRFERAYSSTPICTPARLALLTGRSPIRHGMRSYRSQVPPPSADRLEMASTLAAAGYHTSIVGKNHYGLGPDKRFRTHGYAEAQHHEGLLIYDSRSPSFIRLDEYGEWFNRSCPNCDPLATERGSGGPASWRHPERVLPGKLPAWRAVAGATPYNSNHGYVYPYNEELHPTRWTADVAIQSIDKWVQRLEAGTQRRPLFLKVSFHRPHTPYDPPERLLKQVLDRSGSIRPPATGDWDGHFASGGNCTAADRRYCGSSCGFQSFCGALEVDQTRMIRAYYHASLKFVDEQAGRVLDRMRSAKQEWHETFVLYLSDHGDALGDHNLWRKGYPYEQVASVPFYLRWPEAWQAQFSVQRGTALPHLVELRDVFPTLAEVAGVSLASAGSSGPDGKSVLPLLRHEVSPAEWRDVLMLELALCNFDDMNWVALTDGREKYIRHINNGNEQLFDLTADQYEQHDLAASSELGPWRERLASEFAKEGRGEEWLKPDGTFAEPLGCEAYENLYPQKVPAKEARPNIVFFLADDQDLMLGGASAPLMRETQRLLADRGAVATNFFAHSPICGPSRAQLLTGRYFHNLKIDPTVLPPRPLTENVMHVNTTLVHNHTFAVPLKAAGYTVGLFGKYLNWPADWNNPPEGFDAWFANGGGDYLSPRFTARNLEHLGLDGVWQGTENDYSTSVIGNVSVAWIDSVAKGPKPFMAYIGVKAAHEPFTPAPWYAQHWDASWPVREPRTPNWNCTKASRSRHHGCIATAPMLTGSAESVITGSFKNRWRTLMSLDDLVHAAYTTCEKAGVAERTYFISTSDHGFQLGQFNIPMDKRHVYDWDTRIPFIIRGPGIPAGTRLEQPATLVDLAPTFLSIAGLPKPASMDGRSVLPLLVDETNEAAWAELLPATRNHLLLSGGRSAVASRWRDAVLLTHYFFTENVKCVGGCTRCSDQCQLHDSNCADAIAGKQCWATFHAHWEQDPSDCIKECYPTESRDNNFVALRHTRPLGATEGADTLYAEFQHGHIDEAPIDFTNPNHFEFFDAASDPWLMRNLHGMPERAREVRAQHDKLWRWIGCKGDECP